MRRQRLLWKYTRSAHNKIRKKHLNGIASSKEASALQMKQQRGNWQYEKIFTNYATDKELIYAIYKVFTKLSNNKTNSLIKNRAKGMNRYFSKDKIQITNRHMIKGWGSLTICVMQLIPKWSSPSPQIRLAAMQNMKKNTCWWECGEAGALTHCRWGCKLVQTLDKKYEKSWKIWA